MKTYRQKMQDWVRYNMSNTENLDRKKTFEEVLKKLKELESEEKAMVNKIYHEGNNDCEVGLPHKSNVYESKFKLHDELKRMIGR